MVGGVITGRYVMNKIESVQNEAEQRPRVVFVLGGPGSGKGTNCSKLVEDYGYIHLSAGDLLRAERASGSDLGDMIEGLIREGKIVPSEITVRLLKQAMEKAMMAQPEMGLKFLIDGFPRNLENLDVWEREVDQDTIVLDFVVVLECDDKELEERLLARGATSGRSDDNVEAIRKRFATHHEATKPVINRLAKGGKVRLVDASRPLPEVYNDLKQFFKRPGDTKYSLSGGLPTDAKARQAAVNAAKKKAAAAEAGGEDEEGGGGGVLFELYEASDGFRGTYAEVLAHEKEFGLEEQPKGVTN